MPGPRFREITVSGPPAERGEAHGAALAAEISATIDYYAGLFKRPAAEILARAKHFQGVIRDFHPAFAAEIEGIAAGAGVKEPLWVYALNARSEILSLDPAAERNECTALCFAPEAILGQNWDWSRPLESLAVLLQVRLDDGRALRTITEPGIIGKIGLNSNGVGACINILLVKKPLDGVPIHVVMRAALEAPTAAAARATIERSGLGKASNILFGDAGGNFSDVEFAGDEAFWLEPEGEKKYLVHTNHYLARPLNPDRGRYRCSYSRWRTATARAAALDHYDVEAMKAILSDRSDDGFPIFRRYRSGGEVPEMGTLATIVMDLKARRMHVRKGHGVDSDFAVAFASDPW